MRSESKRKLTLSELIVLGCVTLWGVVASILTVITGMSLPVTTLGFSAGGLTVVAAVLGFWFRATVWSVLGASAILSVALLIAGVIIARTNGDGIIMANTGMIGLIITGCTIGTVLQMTRAVQPVVDAASPARPKTVAAGGSVEHLLSQIYENTMLSDSAKRVIFREREIEMLHSAIEHDIAKGDYGAALALCDDISNLFGQRETAERFRQSIENARREHYEAEIHQSMQRFESYLGDRDWARSHQEAARIRRLFPDAHVLHEIDHQIEAARKSHKDDLEARFLEAAKHEDVERAMELLKELDRYLSREEADQFKEVAQGVVTKHRDNLGVQFKLAVNDRRWFEAAQIGDTIIREFPNTKMADEVRSLIDVIRTRATQAAVSAHES